MTLIEWDKRTLKKNNNLLHTFSLSYLVSVVYNVCEKQAIYLEKCKIILEIPKNNNLTTNDVDVPVEINDIQRSHSKTYRQITALLNRYRSTILSQPSSHEGKLK